MTAKEVLKYFEDLLTHPKTLIGYGIKGVILNNWTLKRIKAIKQALTPPTAEEVCKLLSQYYEIENEDLLFYRSRTKTFVYDTELVGIEEELVWLNEEGNIEMLNPMKPNITTEIGKFYESLEEK